jgi:predicted nucleic acid-binding protein
LSAYADTSFLASLYVLDANSVRAASQMKRTTLPLLFTSFGELELTNAISLRLFRKELTSAKIKAAFALLRNDLDAGVLLASPLPLTAFHRAIQIARRQTPRLGTRTLDVLHVAAALVLQANVFHTFDQRQADLAAAEGLSVSC